jgi:hypothetical protein
MLDLRRRQFLTLLGGALAARPVAARAQHGERMRRVAFLHPYTEKRGGLRLSRADSGAQVLPLARMTVPPSLPA